MSTTSKTDSSAGQGTPPPPMEYCYMFDTDKRPSTQLDALLRAIGFHVAREIGDKEMLFLTPQKLAAFYKAVGGDYDSFFVSMPDSAISFIWQVTGCQHSLQPTDNDFEPPSIPALTPRGFCRWESLEILLGPEEHVPFLQFAVKNWNLKHPETGQPFPLDLPRSVFPSEPDVDVDRWHQSCAKQMRNISEQEREAVRKEAQKQAQKEAEKEAQKDAHKAASAPDLRSEQPKFAYSHVRGARPYFERSDRPERCERSVPFNHVPGRFGGSRRSPERMHEESRVDEQGRRKSFSDYNMPPPSSKPPYGHGAPYLDPNASGQRPLPTRRHSQPRHAPDTSDDEVPPPRRRPAERSPPKSPPRRHPSTSDTQSGPDGRPSSSYRSHRSEMKGDDLRRRSPSLREKVTDKVSNLFTNGTPPERPRNSPRTSYSDTSRPRRSRDRPPPSRLNKSLSDLESDDSSDLGDSEDEAVRVKRAREERDRERRYRDRERERERDEERRDRAYLRRPHPERRASSHADMDRRRDSQQFDPRSMRDDRRRWDRRAPDDDRESSPIMGVGGRRYPEAAYS